MDDDFMLLRKPLTPLQRRLVHSAPLEEAQELLFQHTVPGTTFPSVQQLSTGNIPPGNRLLDASVTFSGYTVSLDYPTTEGGNTFLTAPFNGYAFETAGNNPPISGVDLAVTNIPGIDMSRVSYGPHSINLNESGLTLPSFSSSILPLNHPYAKFNVTFGQNVIIAGAELPPGDTFALTDTSTGQSVSSGGNLYTGPVSGLQHEIILNTSDNVNISAATPNVFIHTGSGQDALQALSGTNVLDGGTGSNFLTGGSGVDTFFVDDRNPLADIWSTVANLQPGDAATVWGLCQISVSRGRTITERQAIPV